MQKLIFLFFSLIFLIPKGDAQILQKIDNWDYQTLKYLETTRTEEKTHILKNISDANNYVNAAIPLGLLIAGTVHDDKAMRQNALYVATSSASTALFNFALKNLFKRKRPFNVHVSLTPVYIPKSYSFPSGHTSLSFSTATALSRAYPKWYVIVPSYLWAGTVGYSRMYLGAHNPSDVIAGGILGTGTALGFGFMKK